MMNEKELKGQQRVLVSAGRQKTSLIGWTHKEKIRGRSEEAWKYRTIKRESYARILGF